MSDFAQPCPPEPTRRCSTLGGASSSPSSRRGNSAGGRWQRGGRWSRPYGRGSGYSSRGAASTSGHTSISCSPASALAATGTGRPSREGQSSSPYSGWTFYFSDEEYNDHSETVRQVQVLEKYLLSWKQLFNFDQIEDEKNFTIELAAMCNDAAVQKCLPNLNECLKNRPESVINCLGLAMHQLLRNEKRGRSSLSQLLMNQASITVLPKIEARVLGYEPLTQLKHIKASYYGKFVSVKGTVVRVSNLKPVCVKMAFSCAGCNGLQVQSLPDGKYVVPSRCARSGCRSRTFLPERASPLTECADWQVIRVQESATDDRRESGRIPRTVDCELTADLVDSAVPGDVVTVSGVVKVTSSDAGHSNRGNKDKCMFLLYIHANSLVNSKGKNQTKGVGVEFSATDMEVIEEIRKEKNLFRFLVSSLCPSIYGHEMVKAGFVLALFGGTQRFPNDKNHVPVRGDPHVLVVGDPGLGKSQMLQAVSNVAPRSVYVCGNSTTTSGLTVTLSKDGGGGGGGDYALEAGALVLADQGCCCIDEFDKMGNQHQALLEAMEQQSISIAKAGIVCSLPAKTSIIAAANPIGGHYNKAKTVSENLRMGSALLSRFDLVFIMLDRPDAEMDSMLSDHVMALHAGTSKGFSQSDVVHVPDESDSSRPLANRLKLQRGEAFEPLPAQLFRKYIGYARKKIHAKIGSDAAKVLQNFYLNLRRNHQTKDSTPITTRQLESLIRLTEARARLELRTEATPQDAEDVVAIMKNSMIDTYSNEWGFLDFQRSQHGSGMSAKSQAKKLISLLNQYSERSLQSVFSVKHMRELTAEAGMKFKDFDGLIASLNNQGYLLQKGSGLYQLQTSDI